MKNSLSIFIFVISSLVLQGQNMLDDQGLKTGPWKVDYPNGKTLYEARFIEGRPVGMMIRYYDNGAVRAKMKFDPHEDRSSTELFYKDGQKAAVGNYVSREKDSVWTYYSEFDGTMRVREHFVLGKLHGTSASFYNSGKVSEEVEWSDGLREGSWMQFFEDGSFRLKGHHENDRLNGPYEVWFPDNTLMMEGFYKEGQSEGTWHYYNDRGELLHTIEYKNGVPADQEEYLKIMQDTLLRYDTITAPQPFQQF